MGEVKFYRDKDLPFEIKVCDSISDLSYKKHNHEEYSLGLVREGASVFWCAGQETKITANTMVFIPSNVVHACNPYTGMPWRYDMLYVKAAWVDGFMASCGSSARQAGVRRISPRLVAGRIVPLLAVLQGPDSFLAKEAALQSLFEELEWPPAALETAALAPQLEQLKEYIHANFREKVTLAHLEAVSGLDRFQIIRAFNQAFTIPPHTYQTLLRINYAKGLLLQEGIAEAGYAAGFYDQSHFHKVFKQHVGTTPEQYRRSLC